MHEISFRTNFEVLNSIKKKTYEKKRTLSEKNIEIPNNLRKYSFSEKFNQNTEEKIQISPRKNIKMEDCQDELRSRMGSMNLLEVTQPVKSDELYENLFYPYNYLNMMGTYNSVNHKYSFDSLNIEFYDSCRSTIDNAEEEIFLSFD